MKVAIPSMDGQSISAHFGRSRYFLVVEVAEGLVITHEQRSNEQASGGSREGHAHGQADHHGHDHGAFARLLMDCEAVLCGGIGMGARSALEGAGLKVCLVDPRRSPEDVARQYAAGRLMQDEGAGCDCSGAH